MKKSIALVAVAAILVAAMLAGCSNEFSKGMSVDAQRTAPSGSGSSTAVYSRPGNNASLGMIQAPEGDGSKYQDKADEEAAVANGGNFAEKIIYKATANIETLDFDATIKQVSVLLAANGAFVEDEHIGGRNYEQTYYGVKTSRTAQYTLRVPANRLKSMTESLDSLGNVVWRESSAENITSQFVDTESRLKSYRIQEDRLLDMLKKAENLADMLTIETRLAEVRYSIESLTTTLRNWQSQVDYSTLSLYISEVEVLTETEPVVRTYWQEIGDGLQATTSGVGRFFTGLFKFLVVSFPVFAVLIAFGIIALVIVKWRIRRNKAKAAAKVPPINPPPAQ